MKTTNTFLALVLAAFLFLYATAYGQLTGTKNIPGDYATLAAAITDLNTQGVGGGGVILNLLAGNPQTSPAGGYSITTLTGTSGNPIVIQGNGNTITAFTPQTSPQQTDAIFKIVGGDWITIQNFIMQENASNTVTTHASNTMTEFGVALFMFSATDGAQNNTIQNNTISLGVTYQSAIGIFSTSSSSQSNGAMEASATSGTNSNNKFYNNTITNVAYGMYFICPPITATVFESGIDIGGTSSATGNNITFGNLTTATLGWTRFSSVLPAGITFRNGGAGNSVRYNTITSNSVVYAQSGGLGGIVTTIGTVAVGVTYTSTRSDNTITLTNNGTTALTGIDFGYGLSTGTIISNNNQITINQNSTAAVSAAIIAIRANYASATNTLNSNNITVNQSPTVAGSVTSPVTGITGAGVGTIVSVNENIITFKQAAPGGTATYSAGAMTYITVAAGSGTVNVNSNQLLTTGSTIRSTGTLIGINHEATITVGITINLNIINIDRIAASGTITGTNEFSTPSTVAHTITNNSITFTNLAGTSFANGIMTLGGVGATTTSKAINGNTINITGTNTETVIGIQTGKSYGTMNNNFVTVSCGAPTVVAYQATGTGAGAYTMTGNSLSLISSTTSPLSMIGFNVGATGPFQIYSNIFTTMNFSGVTTTSPTVSGIAVAAGTGNNVFSNDINNISVGAATSLGSPVVRAIALTGGSTNVYKNKIYGIITNASGTTILVSGITITAGTTNTIYNNLIGDLRAPTSASTDGIRGINITSTTASSTINVYYNTVLLSAASTGANFGTSGIFHTASATATTATLNLRNNIIVNNSTAAGTGLSVAYRRSGTALANYASTSNNNNFFAPTIMHDSTTAYTISTYKTLVTPRDAASFSENPTFISTSGSSADFLHLSLTQPTQCEAGAQPIAGITDDFDGVTRNVTTPDVGADEGDFVMPDLAPPEISYTPLLNTGSTANRSLVVTVTDASGVPTTTNGWPNLYWMKTGDAGWTAVQPASVTGSQYTYNFGGSVTAGNVVSYYVVAQDNATPPNISAFPSAGASGFTANPPAASTPPTTPSSYLITATSLSGDYTVGLAGVYTTITAAVTDLNLRGVSAATSFTLVDATYPSETYPITIDVTNENLPSATNTVTIRPAANLGVTVSGSSAVALFRLNGADFIRIDGLNTGGSSLTLENINTGTSSVIIWVGSKSATNGATNNIIRNCTFIGNAPTTTFAGIISSSGTTVGSVAEAPNSNNTYQNNIIRKSFYGIGVIGPTGNETGLLINGNTIGSTVGSDKIGFNGIAVFQQQNAVISNNTIMGVVTATSSTTAGIRVAGTANGILINANSISDVKNTHIDGHSAIGISLNSSSIPANVSVTNNLIWDVAGHGLATFTTDNGYGINILSGGGYNLYFNSVNLATNQTLATGLPACLIINSAVTTANTLDIRNNIFSIPATVGTNRYAVISNAANTVFSNLDNNVYFTSGTNLGYSGGTDRASLTAWRTWSVRDVNSIAANPMFTAEANLQPLTGSPLALAGTAISGITTDITGITRHATTPTIGAFEALASASASNNIPAGNTSPVSFPGTGTTIQFTVGNTGSVDLTIAVIHSGPGGTLPSGLVNIAPQYWAATVTSGTVTGTYSLTLDITGVPGVGNAATLRLLKRDNASSSWVNLGVPTTISGNLLTWAGLTSFSDFGLGGESENPLPVELSTFAAVVKKRDVLLTWETQTEMNAHSFEVQRSLQEGIWSKVGEVMAHGNSNSPKQYSLSDTKLNSGQYSYRLKMIDNDGVYEYSKVVAAEISNPKEYALSQNYPNPFNPSTKIEYQLPFDANVTIELYGITGEKIADLIKTEQAAGFYTLDVNGNSLNLTSGVYIYRMVATGKTDPKAFVSVKKMLMLK